MNDVVPLVASTDLSPVCQRWVRPLMMFCPNRQLRRRRGKSDTTDAESAARAALNGEASGTPKSGDATVESIRVLRVARRSAVKASTQARNQLAGLIVTAPDVIHESLNGLSPKKRAELCARFYRSRGTDVLSATKNQRCGASLDVTKL
jgi:transposase